MTPTTTRGSEKIVHRPAIYSGVWTDDLDSVLHWTWLEHWEAERERRKNKSKPSASELRQAIALGTKLAEEEALFKLAMKAKQFAEHDRRRPRLVYDRDRGTIE